MDKLKESYKLITDCEIKIKQKEVNLEKIYKNLQEIKGLLKQ